MSTNLFQDQGLSNAQIDSNYMLKSLNTVNNAVIATQPSVVNVSFVRLGVNNDNTPDPAPNQVVAIGSNNNLANTLANTIIIGSNNIVDGAKSGDIVLGNNILNADYKAGAAITIKTPIDVVNDAGAVGITHRIPITYNGVIYYIMVTTDGAP